MTTASFINMRKCLEINCPFYVVLNYHHIVNGIPYWTCSKGDHPDYCRERQMRFACDTMTIPKDDGKPEANA